MQVKHIINKSNLVFLLNEIILRLFPFLIFALPYFFYSKKFTGHISFTLSLLVPIGVYVVGNIRQEAIKLDNNDKNLIDFLSERLKYIIFLFGILIIILCIFFKLQLSIVIWKVSDTILDLLVLPYFIGHKYFFMLKISLIKICSFILLFFVCLFFNNLDLLFYYIFIINIFVIFFLSKGKNFNFNLKNIELSKNFINLIGIMALIDSIVVQIPKYFLKINNHYELIADFTIYFYLVFPIGLLMEPLSLLLLNKKGLEQKKQSKATYYTFLVAISLFAFLLLSLVHYANLVKIDYISAVLCMVFGVINYGLLHTVNKRIVEFSSIIKIRLILPHLMYLFSMLCLSALNFTYSLHLYFFMLIISCIIKWGFIKYDN